MVGVGCGSTDAVVAQTMHQVMMAKSQGALKEGYKQGPWRVARRPLAACYAAASEQDKGGFHVDCGNLFGRFGRLCGCCCVVLQCTVGKNSTQGLNYEQ